MQCLNSGAETICETSYQKKMYDNNSWQQISIEKEKQLVG